MKKFVYTFFLLFSFLGVVFIPFSFRSLGFQSKITQYLFDDLILFLGSISDTIYIANPEISSDSTTLYLLVGVLFLLSIPLTFALFFYTPLKKYYKVIIITIHLILTFYLSLIMLKYGFDKFFKAQFYLPEPNTLFTPLGFLDKDILYWSTMGTSYSYSIFLGLVEVLAALLLLFSRIRVFGLVVLSGILVNVVFVNFGFDISVKLYSCFLLQVCILLLVPFFKVLLDFFIFNKSATLPRITGKNLFASAKIRYFIKAVLIIFFFTESVLPYVQSGNFNDDRVPTTELHGAYQILNIESQQGNQPAFGKNLKRIFIHRHNYFILQYQDDTMEDFKLKIIPAKNQFVLTNYNGEEIHVFYDYSKEDATLKLNFIELNLVIYTKALPWKQLPLLQPLFHWTVDEIK